MKARRKFIRNLSGLAAMLAINPAARAENPDHKAFLSDRDKELEGGFFHMVFFWLIDDTEEVHKKFMKELKDFVGQVEEIKKVHIGPPADTDRDVIDNSYSYSLLITFDSRKEHDIYQEHAAHLRFIENASALWTRVLVYDSVNLNQS